MNLYFRFFVPHYFGTERAYCVSTKRRKAQSALSDLIKGGVEPNSDHVDNYSSKVCGLESLTSVNDQLLQ